MTFKEQLHNRWANLHPFIRFLIFVAMVALFGAFALKPAYRIFKNWRLEENLSAAKQALTQQHMGDARDLSLTVLRAGDPRIDAYRILEKSMSSLRDPRHGKIARALLSHPNGSDDDRLNGFRAIASEAALGVLGQEWAALPERCQQHPGFAVLFSARLIREHRLGEAASVLLGIPESARNASVEQSLIRLLIRRGNREAYEEAQRRITANWPTDGSGLESWMEVFEELPIASLQLKLLAPLRKHLATPIGQGGARQSLALARIDYASQSAMRAELLNQVITRWKNDDPCELARFLNDLGLHSLLLETILPGSAAKHPELFTQLLEALERTDDWQKVIVLLEENRDALPRAEWFAHQSLAASKNMNNVEKTELWKSAMVEAGLGNDSCAYMTIHRIARDGGMQGEADEAMLEAIFRSSGPLPLYSDLKPLLTSLATQGRENILLRVCAIYLLFEPGNPVILTQYAYLACLNNLSDPATILEALKPMAAAFPDALPMQCVLATVYIDNGKPEAAAQTLDRLKLQPESLAPGYRATFLTTEVLNKRMSANDAAITGFPRNELLPSERKKFAAWIKEAK